MSFVAIPHFLCVLSTAKDVIWPWAGTASSSIFAST